MVRAPSAAGFTIIETIVAIGILSMVLAVVASSYGRFASVQREEIGQQEMQEDTRLFLQLFNREARTAYGSTYQKTAQPRGIVFRNQERRCVLYAYDTGNHSITRAEAEPAPTDSCAGAVYDQARRLTDVQNTIVTSVNFDVYPATGEKQGLVSVQLQLHPAADPTNITHVQSTVTSRQIVPYAP